MRDTLLQLLYSSLTEEDRSHLDFLFQKLDEGDYLDILNHPLVKELVGYDKNVQSKDYLHAKDGRDAWTQSIAHTLESLLQQSRDPLQEHSLETSIPPTCFFTYFLIIALACMNAFLQSNVTGPPLNFHPAELLLPKSIYSSLDRLNELRRNLRAEYAVDGIAIYELVPHLELFGVAKAVLDCSVIKDQGIKVGSDESNATIVHSIIIEWIRLRLDFLHQRLLTETAPSLQATIFDRLERLEPHLTSNAAPNIVVEFTLERAAICNHYGLDGKARASLGAAVKKRNFQFKLTGVLGKRTRFQQEDVSQLVVLASSDESGAGAGAGAGATATAIEQSNGHVKPDEQGTLHTNGTADGESNKPINVNLNDDTLLDNISFNRKRAAGDKERSEPNGISGTSPAPMTALDNLDPGNQPLLEPLDSIILLLYASSITNTSPSDGITREETLPFAVRVLQGGSSNWQIYSQALLLRSRIEGYRSRTTERGLLQLQALVDQVLVELTSSDKHISGTDALNDHVDEVKKTSTFLPKTEAKSSASVAERLRYVWLLSSPTRWELEVELAARWVSLGGLKSALEIYERLEMWPEIALCWAGIEREDKARRVLRKQLYYPSNQGNTNDLNKADINLDQENYQGSPRQPPPLNAPRLYCILGDIEHDPAMYEAAWEVSKGRYARAQRSLGRHYFAQRDFSSAAKAYQKALKVSAVTEGTWFALGCAYLELEDFKQAIEAFSRAVQLDSEDAEAWSNLAAALLHLDRQKREKGESNGSEEGDEERKMGDLHDSARHRRNNRLNALKALKHAASLKYDNFRIWENLLTVAASTTPPSYIDLITAQTRLIEIRGPVVGERAVDVEIVERLVGYVMRLDRESRRSDTGIVENPNESNNGAINPTNAEHETDSRTTEPSNYGIQRLTDDLLTKQIIPLITSYPRLWNLVSRYYIWKGNSRAALDASEKGWRSSINATGGTPAAGGGNGKIDESEDRWNEVVDVTIDLVDAYESLGPRVVAGKGKQRGQGGGTRMDNGNGDRGEQQKEEVVEEEVVAKDWRFKARSALRSVMGKGKGSWEGTEGWERLVSRLEELKITKG